MDTLMTNLPPEVNAVLTDNFTIVQVVAMFSIGAWNSLEVVINIFERFKKYRGLYFWSMQVAAWGILLHAIVAQIRYTQSVSNLAMAIPFILGWMCMVTGQVVALYSRLHLVVHDIRHIRWVLWMIIANFFILHVPMTVLFFNLGHLECHRPAMIYDRIQVLGFALQDTLICAIYIHESFRALKPVFEAKGMQGRRIIYRLLFVNSFGILLNVCIVLANFRLHYLAVSFKTVAYSIKLKLEFHALTQLRELTRTYPCTLCQVAGGHPRASTDINIFDMLNQPTPSNTEARGAISFGGTVSPGPVRSTRSSTQDFHDALRQTSSNVDCLGTRGDSRPWIRSVDTRSTVELTLLESPKQAR